MFRDVLGRIIQETVLKGKQAQEICLSLQGLHIRGMRHVNVQEIKQMWMKANMN